MAFEVEFEFDLENPLPSTFYGDYQYHSDVSLTTLFHNECDHMPSNNQSLQSLLDFTCTRREIMSLILHFSSTFDDSCLSYLAVNYLDRFLSVEPLPGGKPWISRLVAVSCISLALKMRRTEFSVVDMQHDDGLTFDSQRIERMEYIILDALKWRMRSITPFCFIDFFVSLFKFKDPPPLRQALKARAIEIIFTSQNEIELLEFKPSVISASALLSASYELFPLQFPCYKKAILNCSFVNKENLLSCYGVMQDLIRNDCGSIPNTVSSTSTPVTVLDLKCFSSDNNNNNKDDNDDDRSQISIIAEEGNANATAKQERDPKRRNVGGGYRNDNTYQLSQIQHCN